MKTQKPKPKKTKRTHNLNQQQKTNKNNNKQQLIHEAIIVLCMKFGEVVTEC